MNKEEKFQYKLALFVFVLTIISSIIGGYFVYKLTLDKEPYLIVSPYREVNKTFDKLSLQIANIKETPATIIRVHYQLEGAEQGEVAEPEIPYLAKGNAFVEIDFNKLDEHIKNYCREKLIEMNLKEFDKFQINKNFKVVLRVTCNECTNENVLLTNQIIYNRDIKCEYTPNKKDVNYDWGVTWNIQY